MTTSLAEIGQKKLPFALAREVDRACDCFEGAWQANQRPCIEDFLATVPAEAREVLLAELIGLEVRYRLGAGERPRAEDYASRFPALHPAWLDSVLAADSDADTGLETTPTLEAEGAGWPVIAGYDILGVLGEGGMGVVYKARHRALQRLVALKMILPSRPEDVPALLARFRAEAEAQARLQHPNIVQIFEVGETGGRPYLALEYLEGGSLDKRLVGTPQPPRAAARLVEVLARAVHAAHQCQIVHRDLKPANILLQAISGAEPPNPAGGTGAPALDPERWILKITDFGVAKFLDADRRQTQSGVVVGTASYMAPEQARGRSREIGPATDTYALGAILYELLTGRPPFKGASPVETLEQVVAQDPVSPKRLQPKMPADLVTICLKCLEKEPGHRYASALALADDLRRFQAGEPIRGRRPSLARQVASWCRRNPALAAASGLAGAALVAVVAVSILFALSESKAAANLRAQQQETEAALNDAKRLSALRACDQGYLLCRHGDPVSGMNWFARGLQEVPAGATELQQVFRANLAGWYRELHPLRDCLEHPGGVRGAAFSPDGQLILTVSDKDRTVRLWRAADGQLLHEMVHARVVRAAAFRADSRLIATGSKDGIRFWSTADGQPRGAILAPAEGAKDIWAVAFHPRRDQVLLTGSGDHTARLWHVGRRQLLGTFRGHGDVVPAVAFSPDGQTVLTGSVDKSARLWDVDTRKELDRIPHPHTVWAVAFSPDGRTFLTGCNDNIARLWEVAAVRAGQAPQARRTFAHKATIRALAFHRGGRMILTGSADSTARLWDVTTGEPIGSPVRHRGWVMGVAFCPDDQGILTGSLDGTARFWDMSPAPERVRVLHQDNWVTAVAFSPDGQTILTANREGAFHWYDAQGHPLGQPVPFPDDIVRAIAISPTGKTFVAGTQHQTARLWDMAKRQPFGEVMAHPDAVTTVAFHPKGQLVLTGCMDGWARLWDAATGRLLRPLFHQERGIHAVAFSPDGRRILSGGGDKMARLWDADTGAPIGQPFPHDGVVSSVAFSPDGQMAVTGSQDFTARLWDLVRAQPRGSPLLHEGWVWAVAFSPDGQTIVTGSADGTARRWDLATGMPIGPPLQHQAPVRAVAFHPDGQTILTGSQDNTARLWKMRAPVRGDVERILLWTQVLTGVAVDHNGGIHILDGPSWRQRRQRLAKQDGPPLP